MKTRNVSNILLDGESVDGDPSVADVQAYVLPASHAQERLWFVDRLNPGSALYSMPLAIRLSTRVSRTVLERCLSELVRRHETLRTTFASRGDRLVQVVAPPYPQRVPHVDLRLQPRGQREQRLAELLAQESRRPFDHSDGPLFRAKLYQLADDKQVLLLVLHHIICDAWSMEVLVDELTRLYVAFEHGLPSPLRELTLQYADWAQWQRDRLEAGAMESGLAFWRDRLVGGASSIELPTDHSRPGQPSYRGGMEYFFIPPELAAQLKELARREGCTLYMLLLSMFSVLLMRYSGQTTINIGSPFTNRNVPEVEGLIGMFVNTVVMRVDLCRQLTVSEFLRSVRETVLDAQSHAEIPLDQLLESLPLERGHDRHPLFQVFFSLQTSALAEHRDGGVAAQQRSREQSPPTTGTSKFDLSLLMTDSPAGMSGAWEYATDLFEVARVRRFSGHFLRLLEECVREPGSKLQDLPITPMEELDELSRWERGFKGGRKSAPESIHERFAEQVRRSPHAIAIEAGTEQLTYAELMSRVRELSCLLRTKGIGPEVPVGLCLTRGTNLVAGVLAILQSGGAYVPLDPKIPPERLRYIASNSRLQWVLVDSTTETVLPEQLRALRVDTPIPFVVNAPAPQVYANNLAYILYTSGTTGRPKGVAVPHVTVCALLDWATANLEADDYARVLASTSICFDLSVFELFLPLTCGGTVVLVENVLTLAEPDAPNVTLVNTVPSAMRELTRVWRSSAGVRRIILAGETLSRDLVRNLAELVPDAVVHNLYGPTETTVYSTGCVVEAQDPGIPPIGRPIDTTSVYILDDRLQRVPVGVPGELYIGGAGVARGYIGNPMQTAERYLPDPYAEQPGSRMYRTGDSVSWRSDGSLEYLGRLDHQVKLRGHRIELGEIESVLREHERVREAVVSLRTISGGNELLVAYLTVDGSPPATDELLSATRRQLNEYMVPSKFVVLPEFPRTPSGKIDRGALPEPDQGAQVTARAPATEIEAALCQVFADVLGVPDFDPDTDLFSAGGHSLLATRVVAQCNDILGLDLPLSAVFEHPSPAGLAARAADMSGTSLRIVPRHRDDGDLSPLSYAQEGMWFYDRLRPGTAIYNIPVVFPVQGAIDPDVLQRSVDALLERHQVLRTSFRTVDGEPAQMLVNDARVAVVFHDLSEMAAADCTAARQQIMLRETHRPFDLQRAPLMRVVLVQSSALEQHVLIVMHHIISDGWSMGILTRQLADAYEAVRSGLQPELGDARVQYADYVDWQRQALGSDVLQEEIDFFRTQLEGAPPLLLLPIDRERPARPSFSGGIISFEIDSTVCKRVESFTALHGVTAHMYYLAVFAVLLHRYSAQEDVVIGIPIANRSRPELRDVIGLFANTLPLRTTYSDDASFTTFLNMVKDAAVGAFGREDLPFDRLVHALSPTRDSRHHPIFQVLFAFQEVASDVAGAPDVSINTGTSKFDMSITLSRVSDRVYGMLEYATDLFDRESVERMAQSYASMVDEFETKADVPMVEVTPLYVAERDWCETGRARALVEPDTLLPKESPVEPVAESAEVKNKISSIWTQVLGHSEFSTEQSFFEVGGHSISAIVVNTMIAQELSTDLALDIIFTKPTIDELAETIAQGDDVVEADEVPILRQVERAENMPLSFSQERLWFLDKYIPDLPVYHIPFTLMFKGAEDVGALGRSLERLGERHEVLRTRFIDTEQGPRMVFDATMQVVLSSSDISAMAPMERAAEANRIRAAETNRLFDFSDGPLLRAHLVRTARQAYLLFLTVHHIVADATSIAILQRDIRALYASALTGVPDELVALPIQYADFAAWQRESQLATTLDVEMRYWREVLADAPLVLELPTDKPRPKQQHYLGRQTPLALDRKVSEAVRQLAAEEKATPFMVLLSVFGALLGRWSGAKDLIVGTPVIGRPHPELEQVVGFFSNTLPLFLNLRQGYSFRQLVRHVRDVVIDALGHQAVPFEAIVQELQPERSLAHNPLFQVMFAFQKPDQKFVDPDTDEHAVLGTPVRGVADVEVGTAKFDLTLFLVDEPEIHGAIEYRTDLFIESTIQRIASQLCAAVSVAVGAPDTPISGLFRASDADVAALSAWNDTAHQSIHREALAGELISSCTQRSPSALAVATANQRFSYTELLNRAQCIARRLHELGVKPDSRVAVVAEPDFEMIAAIVGIWLAGGCCVPLDPAYPKVRLSFMIENSGARWLLGSAVHRDIAPDLEYVTLVESRSEVPEPLERIQPSKQSAQQLAYVVYTSGSTGQPKGVAMTHQALVNLVLWQTRQRDTSEVQRTLQFASPSFDVFFQELLLTLSTGGELLIPSAAIRRDPAALLDLCRERRVARLFLPFVALRQMAEFVSRSATLPELREVITAGEQLQITPAIRDWFAALPSCRLINQYGPSETHVVTEELLQVRPEAWVPLPPIGRPVANVRAYILDADLQILPVGVPGDLYLSGLCLARGYLDRPALTAERFLPDPFASEAGVRMYRSGDRARQLHDGRIEYLGRVDDQVKIRGYRVETGEVEAALANLAGVQQAVVVTQSSAGSDVRLVGYVLTDAAEPDLRALRAALFEVLPEPLIPAMLVHVEDFPRTPSGKVDRRRLPTPRTQNSVVSDPATEVERLLTEIWSEVLGVESVDVDDDFFALGGHSLLAARVIVRVNEVFAADLSVRQVFENPTVRRLAMTIDVASTASVDAPARIPVVVPLSERHSNALPMSFAQERMWFLDRLSPGNPAYNLTSSHILPATLNVSRLRRSLDKLVRRHESLRTTFSDIGGTPVQRIAPPSSRACMEVIDRSYLARVDCDTEARVQAGEEARYSFDLEKGPLFRVTLLNFGRFGYQLILSMHHIISDAWSMNILRRDLFALYEAMEQGGRPSLPDLRVQYADFAAWQRTYLSGEVLENMLSYWREHLSDAPQQIRLPTDRNSGARGNGGGSHSFRLDSDTVQKLEILAHEEGATIFMVMLTLYVELLGRYSGQKDLLVGAPIGVRQNAELENVVGLFVNTLVLRGDLSGDPSFRDMVQRIRSETIAAFSHAELPFDRLVEELRPRRDTSFSPLVQAAFGLNQGDAGANESATESGSNAAPLLGNGSAKFELSLVMTRVEGGLTAVIEFNRDLFDAATVTRMAEHFRVLAAQVVSAPDAPMSQRDLASVDEARSLAAWERGAEVAFEEDLSELVKVHATRAPTRCAVEAPDGVLTYGEFDRYIDRLCGLLSRKGVTTEVRVGVCLGNSMYLPVAMVAVLRSGGAYVPLDPALPDTRLVQLVSDAGVHVVITDETRIATFENSGVEVVRPEMLHTSSSTTQPCLVNPDQMAYLLFTSGSTGRPKGVMTTLRGLAALVTAQIRALEITPQDRVLKFASLSFDASVFEMAMALSAGATFCLEPQDNLLPGPHIITLLNERRISVLTLTPSSLGVLPVEACPSLRLLFVAGEACSSDLVTRWSDGRRMINGYGPTETTVWASYADCSRDGRQPAIGQPVANTIIRVLDDDLRPTPVGIPGEIFIGGPAVARGYISQPGLTAASFVPDPWGEPGSRMYRTGDLARWSEDGQLNFMGRRDAQVKLRGVRIEPGEIEHAISSMAGVSYAVVIVCEEPPGTQSLVAYVVLEPSHEFDAAAIRRRLKDQLPRFLVPSHVVVCDELPRTPSGKVDLRALPMPMTERRETPAALNSIEDIVCGVCADILEVAVGPDDNFFALGGHSLLVTRVISRLEEQFGICIPLRKMFEAETLAEVCADLDADVQDVARIPRLPRIAEQPPRGGALSIH